jgi:hypothetical protein
MMMLSVCVLSDEPKDICRELRQSPRHGVIRHRSLFGTLIIRASTMNRVMTYHCEALKLRPSCNAGWTRRTQPSFIMNRESCIEILTFETPSV